MMKTIDNIRAVLYPENESGNEMVQRFTSLEGKIVIPYRDETELGVLMKTLSGQGYPSKEVLILKKFMGRTYQKCPGSKNVVCCNYRLLNTAFGCLYNCTYCFLNTYLNSYGITQFINLEDIGKEMLENSPAEKGKILRIGTGEFTDSLMFDSTTGLGEKLIRDVSARKDIMLEFKTKSSNVCHLCAIENKGSAVMAWTLNTGKNISKWEQDTASLEERLDAASEAARAGFFTAFHFDPVILYDSCADDYNSVIDLLFRKVPAETMVWISIGGFRYTPGYPDAIRMAFPEESLTSAEMFPGVDGKYRYIRSVRENIYSSIFRRIRQYSDKPFVYLCMETRQVWCNSFGIGYESSGELENAMSSHIIKHFFKSTCK